MISDVLVDTGSAGTLFSTDILGGVGIRPQPSDILRTIRGVGGIEAVFTRTVDRLDLGGASAHDFEIEVGGMDYGFEINGILGMDFLRRVRAVIDLSTLEVLLGSERLPD